jgi:uncharacterized membrane protein
MNATARPWLVLLLTLGYFVAAHVAFTRASPAAAVVAVVLLVLLLLASLWAGAAGPWPLLIAGAAAALVVAAALVSPTAPLLLPPVLIPAAVAFAFGRTLLPGRTALIERVVRVFHAPAPPEPAVMGYARGVTWAWTLLLGALALTNAWLVVQLLPGGLLDLAGFVPRWPVSRAAFAWFASTGTYLLIGGLFVLELAVRVWRFPHDRFSHPLRFLREARTRWPDIIATFRHG